MLPTTPEPSHWIVAQTSDLLPFLNDVLTNVHDNYYADIEDIIEAAVFHLNQRERPLVIDHLYNLYRDGVSDCPSVLADAMEISVKEIHHRLAMFVPVDFAVSEFDYVGDDIILGGILLD